ncbi:MAG: hypothetical protein PHE17_18100 [Thiothrix sp.]|uniref:hypothetical protein n=1 Tax=Thiothrix sp. TaxID=1032 RepID=UPI00261578C7|nr:hypothetical protein [Thiothrix sp.]MDD5394934.1 hypothetical protein [Thiothrix sp.]
MQQFAPRTVLQDENLITREQGSSKTGKRFSSGMFNDIPVIPNDAIAFSNGYIPFDRKLEPCGGCALWSNVQFPQFRSGIEFVQTSDEIVLIDGTFSPDEIGNYVVNDSGIPARIKNWINENTVQVDSVVSAPEDTLNGWTTGQLNSSTLHKKSNKVLHHIGNRLYISDVYMKSYTECLCLSNRGLSDDISVVEEQGDFAFLFCKQIGVSGGIFRINLVDWSFVTYWKCNIAIPSTRVPDGTATPKTTFKYKYLYTGARIYGKDRTVYPIDHETAANGIDNKLVDYGTKYSERPVGVASSEDTYDQIIGGTLDAGYQIPTGWGGTVGVPAITNGQFNINIDGNPCCIAVDFSGVSSMADVARLIELALRGYNPYITFIYDTDHFVMTNPNDGGELEAATSGTAGVDLQPILKLDTVTSQYYYSPVGLGGESYDQVLFVPTDPVTGKPERQVTHLPVYRSLDFGDDGILKGNNEEQFMLAGEPAAAKVLVAEVKTIGYAKNLIISSGSIDIGDIGSRLRFLDGTEVTITGYSTSNLGYVTGGGTTIASQPCAIGGDETLGKAIRVFRFTQAMKTITRIAGDEFIPDDVGKTIFLPDYYYLRVTGYVDADHLTVAEAGTTTADGIPGALDPQCRNWNDTITDDILRQRVVNYSLWQRFNDPLPECSVGRFDAGFLYAAIRGETNLYYQQVFAGKEYQVGYYNPRQVLPLKDTIMEVSVFPSKCAIYCKHSWYSLNSASVLTFDVNLSIHISILYDIKWNDGIGVRTYSSVKKLPNGQDWVFTNEPGVRICDGTTFTDNLAKDRCVNILKTIIPDITIGYDPFNGITIYGSTTGGVAADGDDTFTGAYGKMAYGTGLYKDGLLVPSAAPGGTDLCLRHAINPDQGIGFYEVPAADMPMPRNGGAGALEVFDKNGQSHSLVYDATDMFWWDVSTRDGAVGTDMSKVWTGKSGNAFGRLVKFGDDRGTFEHEFIRILQAMAYFRPYLQSHEGATGYDAAGYPTDLSVDLNLYKNGELLPAATALKIPFDGVVKTDKKVDAHRIALELISSDGDHLIMNRQSYYDNSKRAVEPDKRLSYELELQKELAGYYLYPDFISGTLLNRYNAQTIASDDARPAQGPEARKSCAIRISAPLDIGAGQNGSCLFWSLGAVVLSIGGAVQTLHVIGTSGSWTLYRAFITSVAGDIIFTPGGPNRYIAHARFYSTNISDDATDYFYNDVKNNSGKIVLP